MTTEHSTTASNVIDEMISMSTHHYSDSSPSSSSPLTTTTTTTATTTTTDEPISSDQTDGSSRRSPGPSRFRTFESLKRFSWTNTSPEHLIRAEMRVFDVLKSSYQGRFVSILNDTEKIWTIIGNPSSNNVPLVLVHGFAGGVGLWCLSLDQLSADRPVYAFDLPGFARSSRPDFSLDPQEAEKQMVDMIEEWRIGVGLNEPFILLGHSFGAFLSTSYAIRYPNYIKQLILVDPWGFGEKPEDIWQHERLQTVPVWLRSMSSVVMKFPPLAGLRVAGPLGVYVMKRIRPDLNARFGKLFNDDRVAEYVYHCNAQRATGELAFQTISDFLAWAKEPMIRRIHLLDRQIPIYFLHGGKSWIQYDSSFVIQDIRPNVYLEIIPDIGHHVYADMPEEFDAFLKRVLINK